MLCLYSPEAFAEQRCRYVFVSRVVGDLVVLDMVPALILRRGSISAIFIFETSDCVL
jgi:hypothetical protein